MNYLSHLYLSNDEPMVQIGNFMGDFVKGNAHQNYTKEIQKGILLHRKIDDYTDHHPIVKQSIERLKPVYGRYSGIVIDMFYDHFLALNWETYSSQSLNQFVNQIHRLFIRHYFKFPADVKRFLPFLIKSRRLETYKTFEGIHRSLTIMSSHSSLPDKTDWAMEQLKMHHHDYNLEFNTFFPDVKAMTEEHLINSK